MAQPHLRVVFGQDDAALTSTLNDPAPCEAVTVCLGDIAQLLADAVHSDRTWLYDFQDDEITISSDLFEVLLAYRRYRRPRS
jgi:hypothetical protein